MKMDKIKEISLAARNILEQEISNGKIAGGQAACFLHGEKIIHEWCGNADMEKGISTKPDTIYRIYSMTKPVTAVVTMQLLKEGKLRLDAPVREYLPEYGNMLVRRSDGKLESAEALTVKNLLNMTSGIVYPGDTGVYKEMDDIMEMLKKGGKIGTPYSTREVIRRISGCPLIFQPGAGWNYGFSADVLGGVLEEVSQMNLGELYRKYIFEPLEMHDTGFYVPKDKQGRFSQLYCRTKEGLKIDHNRYLGLTLCLEPPAFESAGAGLVSTMEDYSHFVNMLACGGIWSGRTILSEDIVQEFSKNNLNGQQIRSIYFPQMKGYGYSHLMRVLIEEGEIPGRGYAGEYGWDGWTGPYFMVDAEREFCILYFVQISAYQDWDVIWKIRDTLYRVCQ